MTSNSLELNEAGDADMDITSIATPMTQDMVQFWQRCFEALLEMGEDDDVWSEYVAGPNRASSDTSAIALQ